MLNNIRILGVLFLGLCGSIGIATAQDAPPPLLPPLPGAEADLLPPPPAPAPPALEIDLPSAEVAAPPAVNQDPTIAGDMPAIDLPDMPAIGADDASPDITLPTVTVVADDPAEADDPAIALPAINSAAPVDAKEEEIDFLTEMDAIQSAAEAPAPLEDDIDLFATEEEPILPELDTGDTQLPALNTPPPPLGLSDNAVEELPPPLLPEIDGSVNIIQAAPLDEGFEEEAPKPKIASWLRKMPPNPAKKKLKRSFNYKKQVLTYPIYKTAYGYGNQHIPLRATTRSYEHELVKAASRNDINALRALLRYGVPVDSAPAGETAFAAAKRTGAREAAELLYLYGARY